jgi:hypothetical protein
MYLHKYINHDLWYASMVKWVQHFCCISPQREGILGIKVQAFLILVLDSVSFTLNPRERMPCPNCIHDRMNPKDSVEVMAKRRKT